MKDCWSIIAVPSKLTMFRLLSSASGVLALSMIIACSPSSEHQVSTHTSVARQSQRDAAQIEDNIKNSYARLAAQHADICPKLIQRNKGDNIINRASEVMVDNYCDYFLYLREGQRLAVETNDRQIEVLLIVPTLHNFADGDYEVKSFDKHVVRLSYNGADYKPTYLNYDITMTVSD